MKTRRQVQRILRDVRIRMIQRAYQQLFFLKEGIKAVFPITFRLVLSILDFASKTMLYHDLSETEKAQIVEELFSAARWPSLTKIRPLVERHPEALQATRSFDGLLPLHIVVQSFHRGVGANRKDKKSLDLIKYLVRKFPGSLEAKTPHNGWSVLHYACCWLAPSDIIEYLARQYPAAITATSNDGYLALQEASQYATHEWAEVPRSSWRGSRFIMTHEWPKAIVELAMLGGLPREQALVEAIIYLLKRRGIFQATKYFGKEEHLEPKALNSLAWTALHRACANSAPQKVIEYLVWQQPSSLATADVHGCLPLHVACAYRDNKLEMVKCLVERYPKSLKRTTKDGALALHVACAKRAPLSVVMYLSQQHPEGLRTADKKGWTPLHTACSASRKCRTSWIVAKYLMKQCPATLQIRDEFGQLPIHIAAKHGREPQFLYRVLDGYPAGVRAEDVNGCIPLHLACGNNSAMDTIRFLVRKYPQSLKLRNKQGWLPLHHACSGETNLNVISFLLRLDTASLQAETQEGWLPIHVAGFSNAPLDVILYLLQQCPQAVHPTYHITRQGPKAPRHFVSCDCRLLKPAQICDSASNSRIT